MIAVHSYTFDVYHEGQIFRKTSESNQSALLNYGLNCVMYVRASCDDAVQTWYECEGISQKEPPERSLPASWKLHATSTASATRHISVRFDINSPSSLAVASRRLEVFTTRLCCESVPDTRILLWVEVYRGALDKVRFGDWHLMISLCHLSQASRCSNSSTDGRSALTVVWRRLHTQATLLGSRYGWLSVSQSSDATSYLDDRSAPTHIWCVSWGAADFSPSTQFGAASSFPWFGQPKRPAVGYWVSGDCSLGSTTVLATHTMRLELPTMCSQECTNSNLPSCVDNQ